MTVLKDSEPEAADRRGTPTNSKRPPLADPSDGSKGHVDVTCCRPCRRRSHAVRPGPRYDDGQKWVTQTLKTRATAGCSDEWVLTRTDT